MDEHERIGSTEEDEVERKLRLGLHMDLLPELMRAVEAEPLRELRCRQLMVALYRCGRRDEAVQTSFRLREALGEVGLELSDETRELQYWIVLEAPHLEWTHPEADRWSALWS